MLHTDRVKILWIVMLTVMSTLDVGVVNSLIVLLSVRLFTTLAVTAFVGISACTVSSASLLSPLHVLSLTHVAMRPLVIFLVILLMGVTLLFLYKSVVYIHINIGGYGLSRASVRRPRILHQLHVCILLLLLQESIAVLRP